MVDNVRRWDWAGDNHFIEWLSHLVGIRIGLAPSHARLQQVVRDHDHLLRDNASLKEANVELGTHVLEAFGLEGAVRVAMRSIILDIRDRLGDYERAINSFAFVMGRLYRPSDEEHFRRMDERHAATAYIHPERVDEGRAAEIVSEAARLHGRHTSDAVAVALDEIAYRTERNVILTDRVQKYADVLDLSELFSSESLATACGQFFDQRFVDFLASNFEEIGTVHWRQFEALVAEYFYRRGFDVQLGPGRNDNGVDIRAWEPGIVSGLPPTLVIQCKREQRKISKVLVKALAADVYWEGAAQGLLVATAEWSPGARELVRTRSYPVAEVNRETLQRWLAEMRTTRNGTWLAT